jgi:hypothetical protein
MHTKPPAHVHEMLTCTKLRVGRDAQGMPPVGTRPKGSGASAPASPVAKRCAQRGDR